MESTSKENARKRKKYPPLKLSHKSIEDYFDLKAGKTALKEYLADPVTYTLDEAEKELGLR